MEWDSNDGTICLAIDADRGLTAPLGRAAPCAAQSPTPATEATGPSPRAQRAALPPSTVSPVIERFMKQSGQDLPPLPPPAIPCRHRGAGRCHPPCRRRPHRRPSTPARAGRSGACRRPSRRRRRGRRAGCGDSATTRPSPLASNVKLKPAPLEPTDLRFPINLATALRLSDARPLIVAAAQASVWVAEAELTQAKVLWIPTLNFAVDYLRHDGGGPDFNKGIMTAPSVNFFYAGAGLYGNISTTDAIYQPLVARQVLNSRHWDIQSAKNDALLRTADAYFRVHQYRGMYAGALYCVERGHDLVERIATLSRDLVHRSRSSGPGTCSPTSSSGPSRRGRVAGPQRRPDAGPAAGPPRRGRAAGARPRPDHPDRPRPVAGRPDAGRPDQPARAGLAPGDGQGGGGGGPPGEGPPFLPTVVLSGFQSPGGMLIQAGIFGLGPNSSLNQWTGRDDVSIQLMWQLESFGIGNLARIKRQRGQQSQAIIDLRTAQDMVAADVNRALARVQSAAARVLQADRALRTGIITFNGQIEGLGQTKRFGDVLVLINRPQEAVYAPPALVRGLRGVLHHGGRVQPGAVRPVPRAGLPRPGGRVSPAARRDPAGGHGAAGFPAPGGQRAAPGNPMIVQHQAGRPRRPRSSAGKKLSVQSLTFG